MEHTAPGPAEGPAGRRGNEEVDVSVEVREGSRFRDAAAALFLQPVRRPAPGPVLLPVRRPGHMIFFLPSFPLPFSGSSQVVESSSKKKFTIMISWETKAALAELGIPSCTVRILSVASAIYRSSAANTPSAREISARNPCVLTPTEICCESTAQLKNIVASLGQLRKRTLPIYQNTRISYHIVHAQTKTTTILALATSSLALAATDEEQPARRRLRDTVDLTRVHEKAEAKALTGALSFKLDAAAAGVRSARSPTASPI